MDFPRSCSKGTNPAPWIVLLVVLAVTVGCNHGGPPGEHTAAEAGKTSALSPADDGLPALVDSPLTLKARRLVVVLADSSGTPVFEAYRALSKIGRDAVPALVEAIRGPYPTTVKQNVLGILGDLGLAAVSARPFLGRAKLDGDRYVSFAADQALRKIEEAAACGLPDLPEDVEVHVVGLYKGEEELDVQLGDSGHIVTQVEVIVDRTDGPVVLVLSAYDPVVWRVGTAPGSKLAGVLVSGYHTQALLGIPATLPHKVISGEQSLGCDAFHASGPEDAAEIEPRVLALTGHRIHTFHGASPTEYFRIGGSSYSSPTHVSYASDLSLDDYPVYRGEIPAGVRGLEELERQGKIRRATAGDIEAWEKGAKAGDASLRPEGVYVVLERITLPPGLFGAHSRAFLIPAGVPRPEGPKGHCAFLYMHDFTRE